MISAISGILFGKSNCLKLLEKVSYVTKAMAFRKLWDTQNRLKPRIYNWANLTREYDIHGRVVGDDAEQIDWNDVM